MAKDPIRWYENLVISRGNGEICSDFDIRCKDIIGKDCCKKYGLISKNIELVLLLRYT